MTLSSVFRSTGSISIVATGKCRFRLASTDSADILEARKNLQRAVQSASSSHADFSSLLTLPLLADTPAQGTSVLVFPLPDGPDLRPPLDIRSRCHLDEAAACLPLPGDGTAALADARRADARAGSGAAPLAEASASTSAQQGLAGRRRRRGWEDCCAGFSSLPGWVWKMFDAHDLAVRSPIPKPLPHKTLIPVISAWHACGTFCGFQLAVPLVAF